MLTWIISKFDFLQLSDTNMAPLYNVKVFIWQPPLANSRIKESFGNFNLIQNSVLSSYGGYLYLLTYIYSKWKHSVFPEPVNTGRGLNARPVWADKFGKSFWLLWRSKHLSRLKETSPFEYAWMKGLYLQGITSLYLLSQKGTFFRYLIWWDGVKRLFYG